MAVIRLIGMEESNNQQLNEKKTKKTSRIAGIIHVLLFHDYSIFLFAIILGVILDGLIPNTVFSSLAYQDFGLVMIIFGSLVIYWAQSATTHYHGKPGENRGINFFLRGPYKYTRNPTNLGLTIMSLGLGFLLNSITILVFVFMAYLVSRFVFIKRQDVILEEKYGSVFNDYKMKVKDWL